MSARDPQIAAALAELEVPEHGPAFDARLRRRLRDDRVRARRRVGLRVVAAAVAAAVAVLVVGIPRTERTPRIGGAQPATAAEVKAMVRRALANLRNARGVVVTEGPGSHDAGRRRFTLTADGDLRLTGGGERIAYDASTGVERRIGPSASLGGDARFSSERRGVAPGPPDQGPPSWILPERFGAFVRALLAARDPRVREIRYDGRPAWRLDVDVRPNAIVPDFSGDRFEITVDRLTGLPVRVDELRRDELLRETRIEHLRVNADLPAGAFTLAFPPGAEVMRSDDGFRRVPLGEVAGRVGYAPLVPARVPPGFHLAEVAVARRAGPTGAEAGNPRSRMVVSLSYRRGLDQFLVTTRLETGGAGAWDDPLATGEGFRDHPERLVLHAGALAGAPSELLIAPRGIPHLWAPTGGLVVTVGGDLSRSQLLAVARSLRATP